ncbi:MAG: hypothetical protein EOO40_02475, partial [Deltaproteobacteria bacterium]
MNDLSATGRAVVPSQNSIMPPLVTAANPAAEQLATACSTQPGQQSQVAEDPHHVVLRLLQTQRQMRAELREMVAISEQQQQKLGEQETFLHAALAALVAPQRPPSRPQLIDKVPDLNMAFDEACLPEETFSLNVDSNLLGIYLPAEVVQESRSLLANCCAQSFAQSCRFLLGIDWSFYLREKRDTIDLMLLMLKHSERANAYPFAQQLRDDALAELLHA